MKGVVGVGDTLDRLMWEQGHIIMSFSHPIVPMSESTLAMLFHQAKGNFTWAVFTSGIQDTPVCLGEADERMRFSANVTEIWDQYMIQGNSKCSTLVIVPDTFLAQIDVPSMPTEKLQRFKHLPVADGQQNYSEVYRSARQSGGVLYGIYETVEVVTLPNWVETETTELAVQLPIDCTEREFIAFMGTFMRSNNFGIKMKSAMRRMWTKFISVDESQPAWRLSWHASA